MDFFNASIIKVKFKNPSRTKVSKIYFMHFIHSKNFHSSVAWKALFQHFKVSAHCLVPPLVVVVVPLLLVEMVLVLPLLSCCWCWCWCHCHWPGAGAIATGLVLVVPLLV